MTIGWIDGTAGASGDMLLAALVDVGVDLSVVQDHLDRLALGIELGVRSVVRGGLGATKVSVEVPETSVGRRLRDVVDLLERLDDPVRRRAISTFERLARAEAAVHRTTLDEVHFHEVGALDSIADVVGVCTGFVQLGLSEVHCSTLSLGSGTTSGEHGPIPIPAPAVLELLRGAGPIVAGPAPFESTTPTGAALLAEWVSNWGPMPAMIVGALGAGAGTRDVDEVANICRLVVGTSSVDGASIVQVDANVDDADPRIWPEAIAAAMDAGAVDAWVTPIIMKKGRPAHTFSALCSDADLDAVCDAIFRETTTIGVRRHRVDREVLERVASSVDVEGGTIGVKTATRAGGVVNRSVEWDDVVTVARSSGRSPKSIAAEAIARLEGTEDEVQGDS